MTTRNVPKFDLQAEIDAIDRRRASLNQEMDRSPGLWENIYFWLVVAYALPISVGVFLGIVL